MRSILRRMQPIYSGSVEVSIWDDGTEASPITIEIADMLTHLTIEESHEIRDWLFEAEQAARGRRS